MDLKSLVTLLANVSAMFMCLYLFGALFSVSVVSCFNRIINSFDC